MRTQNDLDLDAKVNLIRDKERGLLHRELKDKFQVSVGAITNILKRQHEYTSDDESNMHKKVKRKFHNDLSQTINDTVYEWFVLQRAKKIPVSGPILQAYAKNVAQELGDSSGFRASNGWLERFRSRYNVRFRLISGEGAAVDDDTVNDEDANLEHPPTLCEALKMVKRIHLLPTTRHPEFHLFISQLQSKLIDIYLDSNCSKQKSIRDFFKPLGLGDTI